MDQFTLRGFLVRFAAAALLVVITYNPSGLSYVHWLHTSVPTVGPLQVIAGLLLVGAWGFFGHATWRSLGTAGLVLLLALAAAFIWLVVSWGWLSLDNRTALSWVILFVIALLLGIGLSWSHIRRRVTGQTDVEEVDRR
jgi:Family of unknown function (DUF6524)